MSGTRRALRRVELGLNQGAVGISLAVADTVSVGVDSEDGLDRVLAGLGFAQWDRVAECT